MPPRKSAAKKVDNTVYKVTVSGKSFEAALKDFKPKATTVSKRGFGTQHKFELGVTDLRRMTDVLADAACPEDGPVPEDVSDAIYRDLGRFPDAAGIR